MSPATSLRMSANSTDALGDHPLSIPVECRVVDDFAARRFPVQRQALETGVDLAVERQSWVMCKAEPAIVCWLSEQHTAFGA